MNKGVNKVILIGNVGEDPVANQLSNGGSFVKIYVATSESWIDKNTGLKQVFTEWHKVLFYKSLALSVSQHVKRSSKIYVEGVLRSRKYEDSNGYTHRSHEIVGKHFILLDLQDNDDNGNRLNGKESFESLTDLTNFSDSYN